MKIEVLGVGNGLSPEDGNTSFLAWDNSRTSAILFECGYTVYPKLKEMENNGIPIFDKIGSIFVSHLHDDHVGSLGGALAYWYYVLNVKKNVVCPEINEFLKLIGCDGIYENKEDDRFKLIKTNHVSGLVSNGCLYNNTLMYSGDSRESLLDSPEAATAKIVIHECTFESSAVHTNINTLGVSGTPEIRAKTWLIHYGREEYEILSERAEAYGFAGVLKPGQII